MYHQSNFYCFFAVSFLLFPTMKKVVAHGISTTGRNNIFSLLKPYYGLVILLVVFTLMGNGINLVIPLLISHGIDAYGQGSLVFRTLIRNFMLATFFILIFSYLQGIVQTYASEKAARELRKELSDKISRQSYEYIVHANPSRLLTNLTSDIDSIKMFISQAVASIVSSAFIIIGASILLLSINWKLALAVLTIIPLVGSAFYIMFHKVRILFRKSREVIDWLNRVINESILGATLIRVLNSQQQEYSKFLAASTNSRDLGLSILSLFAALIPVITFVSNMAMLTILLLGGHFVIAGSMSLGNFAAFNSYIAILIFPILVIGFMSNIIAQASASFQRISQVMSAPEIDEKGKISGKLNGNITFSNIGLQYGEKPVLKNVSFAVREGSKTGIIGPTAAGKTQVLYLLTGLIKPDAGSIAFDGVDISDYKKETFQHQIGFVFQDSIIFNLSLRENIAFSDIVTDASLEKAIATAELQNFIQTLPDKLDTIVSERGTSLSGGQKQRIMLARALALNPRILLLDDFTARVDRRTEKMIMENIVQNYPDLTIISVTQKISSIRNYDQIILLMEGEIIAAGTHDQLIRICPEYAQINNSQRSTSYYEI
jgi:ATP-binding cassette subfamily B protein